MILGYLAGVVVMFLFGAIRIPYENVRVVAIISLFWPISCLFIVLVLGLTLIGWELDMAKGSKAFGFRRPTNPNIKGFAVTILYVEFQFFSIKKV